MVSKLSNILENGIVERQFSMKSGGTGLSRTFRAGVMVQEDDVQLISETTITATDDDTTYVYINTGVTPFVLTSSTTFPFDEFAMVSELVAVSGVITTINDWRSRSSGLLEIP